MKWKNNYFEIIGDSQYLKLNQKVRGAVAVPFCNQKYLIIKIKRADDKYHLEFPRGFGGNNESFEQTAIRELKEETSIDDVISSKVIGTVMPDSGLINSEIGIVLLEVKVTHQLSLQKSEKIVDYEWVSADKLKELVTTNKIIDGFTLAACAKLFL